MLRYYWRLKRPWPTITGYQKNDLEASNDSSYYYGYFDDLTHWELANGKVQNYFYDLHDQLIKAEFFKKDGTKETWVYSYNAFAQVHNRPTEKAKVNRKSTTSTATKSEFHLKWSTGSAGCCSSSTTTAGADSTARRISPARTSRSGCRTSILMRRRGCTITFIGITSRIWAGLSTRIRSN